MLNTLPTLYKYVLIAVAIYVTAMFFLYSFQRSFIFLPLKEEITIPVFLKKKIKIIPYTVNGKQFIGYYAPPEKKDGNVIIYFHGNAHHAGSRLGDIATVLNHGDGFFMPGYPGYGANEGKPSKTLFLEAAQSAVQALMNQKNIQEENIIFAGESLGTGVATDMAVHFKNAKALILKSPYKTLGDAAQYHYPIFPAKMLVKDNFEIYPIINKISMPLIIVHGEKDTVIPYSHGQEIYKQYQGKKKFIAFQNKGHNDIFWKDFYASATQFIKKHSKN